MTATEGRRDEAGDAPEVRPERARRGERLTALAFGVSIVGAVGLAVVFWAGGQPQLEGLLLGLALGGLGVGLVVWARFFMPHGPVIEERKPLESTEEDIAAFTTQFEQGEHALARRGLLVKLAGTAVAALATALVFPIRSLGPRPGKGFKGTPFRDGVRLVDDANRPIRADDVAVDGLLTAFPEDHTDAADAPTLLIRPSRSRTGDGAAGAQSSDRTSGASELLAFSKLCTHLGCPVGLYQAPEHLLLCPCHQSTFDVLDDARPVFGPATRALPSLPIRIDEDGFVVATGDFESPTGAGFWDRDR
jgi:ubiquinol-cytochrome c reductase iron-sulfur subunit